MQIKETLGEFEVSSKTKIIVNVLAFKNKEKLDVRLFFRNFDGRWLPTRKGVVMPVEKGTALLDILAKLTLLPNASSQ